MRDLKAQAGADKVVPIRVLAITAEPGGTEAVSTRLAEREEQLKDLEFELISDPKHILCVEAAGDIYIYENYDWEVPGSYSMVQPAIVVLDHNQEPISECTWSWKTMGLSPADQINKMALVKTQPWDPPVQDIQLVLLRPVITDLLASIIERRPVKLAGCMTLMGKVGLLVRLIKIRNCCLKITKLAKDNAYLLSILICTVVSSIYYLS